MSFPAAIRRCLRRYATFSGRASRSEYWFFILFLILASLVAGLLDAALFGADLVETAPGSVEVGSDGPVATIFSLAMILPSLAAGWRRMHDTGRSGLYLIYPAIVVVGIATFTGLLAGFGPLLDGDFGALLAGGSALVVGLALIVLFFSPLLVLWWLTRPSVPGTNRYGPNPAEVSQ